MSTEFALTENGALAYSTTGTYLMDLFVKTVRNCPAEYIAETMKLAWNENPETLMKLVFLTRDPRNGKGERDVTFHMLEFLKRELPQTYRLNVKSLTKEFGRIKDLLVLAGLPLQGEDESKSGMYELEVFADILNEDLKSEHPSLAVKWAPREGKKYSDSAKKLAGILFPGDPLALKRYRVEILGTLNQKVKTVEQLMSAGQWAEIDYSTVPSSAMKLYGRSTVVDQRREKRSREGAFIRNDAERFTSFQKQVKEGKTKINTAGIQPHELVAASMMEHDETVQLQWNTLLDKLRNIPLIGSSMAVVDVSGSMNGLPMEVAVALGLVIAELASPPFQGKMITFSEIPHFHRIVGESLHEKIRCMCSADWGTNTDIEKAFQLILDTAVNAEVPRDEMVKALFVFTDMEFDAASSQDLDNPKVVFETIRQMFESSGYAMPKLVFWNLRSSDSNAFPVKMDESGTAYLSGFSAELLKVFLEGIDFNPISILGALLNRYTVSIAEEEKDKRFPVPTMP